MNWNFRIGLCGLLLLGAGCAGESDAPESLSVSVVQGGVSFGDSPEQVCFSVPSSITALAKSGDRVIVGTEQGAFLVGITELLPVEVYTEVGEPAETGSVSVL